MKKSKETKKLIKLAQKNRSDDIIHIVECSTPSCIKHLKKPDSYESTFDLIKNQIQNELADKIIAKIKNLK